jgi:hypothetical protein
MDKQSQRIWLPALGGLILFGMILASSCVFTPRDPAEPSDNNVEWIRPIEPEAVIVNMEAAIEARQALNYENSLADDFDFTPSTFDSLEAATGYFDDWGKARELASIDRLYTQVDSLRLEWHFDPNEDLDEFGDYAIVTLERYQLFVSYTGSDQVVFEGSARMYLRDIGGQWFLYLWDELGEDFDNSWGRMRANLEIAP